MFFHPCQGSANDVAGRNVLLHRLGWIGRHRGILADHVPHHGAPVPADGFTGLRVEAAEVLLSEFDPAVLHEPFEGSLNRPDADAARVRDGFHRGPRAQTVVVMAPEREVREHRLVRVAHLTRVVLDPHHGHRGHVLPLSRLPCLAEMEDVCDGTVLFVPIAGHLPVGLFDQPVPFEPFQGLVDGFLP